MANIMSVRHLQENCRTCLRKLNEHRHNVENLPKAIFRIFKQVTGFKRIEVCLYPKCICGNCYDKIQSFNEFQIKCKENQRILEHILKSNKNDKLASDELEQENSCQQYEVKLANDIEIEKRDELQGESSCQHFEHARGTSHKKYLEAETQACNISKGKHIFENVFIPSEIKEEINDFETGAFNLSDTLSLTNSQTNYVKIESNSGDKTVSNSENQDTTCNICKLTYSTVALLKTHMRNHKELQAVHCKLCESDFSEQSNFDQHIREAHAVTPIEIVCKFGCEKMFTRTKSAEAHYKNEHNSHKIDVVVKTDNCNDKSTQDHSTDESSDDNFDLLFLSKTTCRICQKTYSSPSALRMHMRLHEEKRLFQCNKCEKGFNKKYRLTEHIQEVHAEKFLEIICKFGCGRSFVRFQTAAAHYRNKHPLKTDSQKDIKSNILQIEEFDQDAEAHISTEMVNLPVLDKLTCNVCFQTYSSASTLRVHMRLHQDKRPFQCDQCERSFNKRSRLKMHIAETHTNNPIEIKCKFGCGKIFRRQGTATNHYYLKHALPERVIQPKKNSFVCEDCGRLFKSMASLREHSFTHRPAEDRPHKCGQCAKSFVSKRTYEDHLLRHTGIKNYECSHCGIKKTTLRELRTHVNSHTNKKTYTCSICAKVFNRSENLRLHERVVHQGIRRYKCSYCDQAFGKPDTLKHHVMRHTGEKPHKCQKCDRSFIQAVALRTHMKTHVK